MAVHEPGPELGTLREGFHAFEHPRAGSIVVLDSPTPLHGRAVRVIDWFDRVYERSWKEAALGGEPLATSYANHLAVLGLSDDHRAVVVVIQGSEGTLAIVHQTELP